MKKSIKQGKNWYRLLEENITDVVWIMDTNLRYIYVSPSVERLRGYSVEEVMKQSLEEVLTPSSLEIARRVFENELSAEKIEQRAPCSSRTLELELKRKNGSTVWTEVKINFLRSPNGKPIGILGITRDITERKKFLEALKESEEKLHFLSSSLLKVQEEERKRISMELHDELGQSLIALKFRLNSIQNRFKGEHEDIKKECEYIKDSIEKIIEYIRRLSQNLSPYVLESLGFTKALQHLISDLTRFPQIKVTLNIVRIDDLISQEKQIILYRIFQETLNNIRKHAQATHLSIVIKKENSSLSFLIEDDGVGFDIKKVKMRRVEEKGLGLITIEERVRMLGGVLEIQSEVGKGTKVVFNIPL